MRKLLILGLILLVLSGVAGGQEGGLPSCSAAQIAVTDSYTFDHFDLMGAVMTPEMITALSPDVYEDLADLIENDASSQTLLNYADVLFPWRESFWASHPICDEVFEIGVSMDESASDMAAFLAYHLAGVAIDDNPYVEGMRNGIGMLSYRLSELSDQPATNAGDVEVDLRACSDDDLAILSQELDVFRAILEVPPRTHSLVGLAKYGVAQLSWREKLWLRLQPCDLSLKLGLLMSHITSDLAVQLALRIGKVPIADAPFAERIARDQARLEKLSASVAAAASQRAPAESSTPPLPECGDDEELSFSARNAVFPAVVDALEAAETLPDLLEAAVLHLAWRETLEANLPHCIESLITAGLMLRVTGNHVAALALDIAGVKPELSDELPLNPQLFGIVTIRVIADEIIADIRDSGLPFDELLAAAPAGDLPDCDTVDSGLDMYNLFLDYSDLEEVADSVATLADVLDFRQAQVDWAENHIERLPGCKQAVSVGYMMYSILSDYAAAYALILAGADIEDIPYAETIPANRDRLYDWMQQEL